MRGLFDSLTTRGRSFMAAGGAAIVCGLAIPEPDLVRVRALLVILAGRVGANRPPVPVPAVTAPAGSTHRECRAGSPPHGDRAGGERLAAAHPGCCTAEDVTPYTLGARPRFVLDEIEPDRHRELSYQIRSDTRASSPSGRCGSGSRMRSGWWRSAGRSPPPAARSWSRRGSGRCRRSPRPASWLGEGDGGMRTISAVGEDDAAPRVYQDGDGLHRVHWKSTARYGELMVRREEHQWRNSASVFLDTRRAAHAGTGPASTFEFAVSAAASIGAHLSGEGFRAGLITEYRRDRPGAHLQRHAAGHARGHHPFAFGQLPDEHLGAG